MDLLQLPHGWIDKKLLANGMPGQFPRELILPSRFRVVSCVEDVLIVLLNLAMVVLNDVRNAFHDYSGCREALMSGALRLWMVRKRDIVAGKGLNCEWDSDH
jgi:hypothetical protein